MMNVWTAVDITIASVPIIAFLISIYILFKAKRIHPFVRLTWVVGFLTSISALILTIVFGNKQFGTTWECFFVIFILEGGQGILYFMAAFEFYTSASTMEEILLNKPTALTKKTKNTIFFSVTGIYLLLQAILCFVQLRINRSQAKMEFYNQFDTVPLVGLEFINIFSTGLLIIAVKKLRVLCRTFQSLNESKLVVRVTLALFTLENIMLILCLTIQFAYAKRRRLVLFYISSIFHFLALIVSSSLLSFLALVIAKLSQNKPGVSDGSVTHKNRLTYVAKVKTDEALNQYLRRGHT